MKRKEEEEGGSIVNTRANIAFSISARIQTRRILLDGEESSRTCVRTAVTGRFRIVCFL